MLELLYLFVLVVAFGWFRKSLLKESNEAECLRSFVVNCMKVQFQIAQDVANQTNKPVVVFAQDLPIGPLEIIELDDRKVRVATVKLNDKDFHYVTSLTVDNLNFGLVQNYLQFLNVVGMHFFKDFELSFRTNVVLIKPEEPKPIDYSLTDGI